jgi:hypothetical protein
MTNRLPLSDSAPATVTAESSVPITIEFVNTPYRKLTTIYWEIDGQTFLYQFGEHYKDVITAKALIALHAAHGWCGWSVANDARDMIDSVTK